MEFNFRGKYVYNVCVSVTKMFGEWKEKYMILLVVEYQNIRLIIV